MHRSLHRFRASRHRRGIARAAAMALAAAALLGTFGARPAAASVGLTPGSVVVQDFDALAASGTTNPWTDDVTLPGWSATATSYRASAGSDTTGAMYSYGSGADRALGGLRSTTVGDLQIGLRLRNDSAFAFTGLTVSYAGEQWRDSGATSAQRLAFSYRLGAGDLVSGTWTPVSMLDFVSPTISGSASALDGNASANRSMLSGSIDVALAPGDDIALRWTDVNDAGTDHGLAIDDVTVGAAGVLDVTPPMLALPSTIDVDATGADGATVTYVAFATDDLDGPVPVTCAPASGSVFAPGSTSVGCSATDAAGNVATGSFLVHVGYAFVGFFPPVESDGPDPITNVVRAGAAVPVKFSLGGDLGLGVIERITRDQVPCGSLTLVEGIEETVTAGSSSLSYDPLTDVYTYVWKTEKAWASSPSACRLLDVRLADGSHHVAFFAFR